MRLYNKANIKKIERMGNSVADTVNDRIKRRFGTEYRYKIKLLDLLVLLTVFAALTVNCLPGRYFDCIYKQPELDLITYYEVDVAPRADGSLDIDYAISWKVLDDISEGELTWIKLGLGNANCEITGWGGNVLACSRENTYARVELIRGYKAGETAEIRVSVHQNDMLCDNKKDPEHPFYKYTPGWFNDIAVESYRFTWRSSDGIISDNSDRVEDGLLIWEGTLDKGGRRSMELTYNTDYFDSPKLVKYKKMSSASGAPSAGDHPVKTVLLLLLILLFFTLRVIIGIYHNNYENGRGFAGGAYRGHAYHGGGHRGCACAGCACACACAGGGRAGCSVKDYYEPERDG